jgi:hypothetical protein
VLLRLLDEVGRDLLGTSASFLEIRPRPDEAAIVGGGEEGRRRRLAIRHAG